MTIGQFARRTRLTYKALRLYDSMGLLPPAFVDPDSGYRYYTEEQIEKARLVGLLRRLEMPLERIRTVLALPPAEALAALSAYWHEQQAAFEDRRRLAEFLTSYLQGQGGEMFEIETRSLDEQQVATISSRVAADALPGFIGDAMARVYEELAAAGAQPQAFPFVAYHGQVDLDNDGPVEVCVPFSGSLEPRDGVTVRVEPAHEQAFARLTKAQVAFPQILEAYTAVEKYLEANGLRVAGSPREVYFERWDEAGENEPVCDVAFPYGD